MFARLALLLALPLLVSQTAPPPTDLTAVYTRPEDGREVMRIEVAANGDLRVQQGNDRYLLVHQNQAYEVTAGPGGPLVYRVDDILAVRAGQKPISGPSDWPPIARGEKVVNGRTGIAWSGKPPEGQPLPEPAIVVSNDPELLPIGKALAREMAIRESIRSPGSDGASSTLARLFDTGTPLLFGAGTLKTVSRDPIPAARFEVPAPPEPIDSVRDNWVWETAEKPRPAVSTSFRRAVFAEGKLWLLADNGALLTVTEGASAPVKVAAPEPVLDICVANGAPLIVTAPPKGRTWTMRRRLGNGWELVETADSGGDALLALSCSDTERTILTDKRLLDFWERGRRGVRLSGPIPSGVITTVWNDRSGPLVGVNAGEWGGGLRRIDRATGKVSVPSKRDGERLCGGSLDPDCDPVNGIAPMPGKPGCHLLSIGLVHFMPHGRMLEMCGEQIRRFYYKPYSIEVSPKIDLDAPEPFQTVAFYGAAPVGDSLWVAGLDGLYRIAPDGSIAFTKMPRFENVGGVRVSYAIPGMVLALTSINARVSIGTAAPMLVPR